MRPGRLRTSAQVSLAAVAAMIGLSAAALAQSYPARPLKLIVPLAPGGPADTTARRFASALADALGQSVVVDNRTGASGVVGTEAVVNSPADGYTLLFGSSSVFAVNPAVMTNLRFDVRKDLRLIGLVSQASFMIVAPSATGPRSFEDLVKLAKAQPGALSYASSGTGGIIHLTGELFKLEAGLDMLHIPYRGGGPAMIGVLSGDASIGILDISTILTSVKSGKLTPLAIVNTERSPVLPDVPTVIEKGYPNVETRSWYGLAAPAGVPADTVGKLEAATTAIASSAAFHAGLASVGLQPLMMTPAETAAFIEKDLNKWARVAKAANVRVEP